MHHKGHEIAGKILATHETNIIKDISHDIPNSDEWKKLAATKIWDLTDAKFPVTIIPPTFQSKPGLKFVYINCRSLFKNFDQIVENFKYCDIVCCSETWLRPEIDSSILFFPGKKLFRLDRTATCGKTR